MEEWRAVSGFEGIYEVSDQGRVRSLSRVVIRSNGHPQTVQGRTLKTPPAKSGYPVVTLWRRNRGVTRTVHSLVAEAFIGPRPPGKEVCHNDEDPSNPAVQNLRYDTHQNNLMDSVYSGKNSKMTDVCPRGHLKAGPNRVVEGKFGTRSRCRACNRERNLAYKYGRPFDPENADRKYRELMKENN